MTKLLHGKIAMVTGASSGFGKAIAQRFVEAGAGVIATARRTKRLEKLKSELGEVNLLPLTLDVRDQKQVFETIKKLDYSWSKIDILVNNAGLARGLDSSDSANIDDWNEMVEG